MSRIEHIGRATLYLGDCASLIEQLGPFDALVTDPPYGIGAGSGIGKVTKEGSDFRHCEDWDIAPPSSEVLEALIAKTTHQIIWGGNYFALPATACFLIWDKVQPENFSLAMAEIAWSNLKKPTKMYRWKSMSINGGEPKFHPTQKPLGLMRWCIGHLPPEAATVFDPYMGSGTTGVAAAHAGRSFVGIERDEKYFEIACNRLRDAQGIARILPADHPAPGLFDERAA